MPVSATAALATSGQRWVGMRSLSLGLLLLLVGCGPPEPGAVPGLLGKSKAAVVAQLGAPATSESVDLDVFTNMRRPAVRALRDTLGSDATMEELRWTQGEFFVVVWVGKKPGGDWVVVDSFRWHQSFVIG